MNQKLQQALALLGMVIDSSMLTYEDDRTKLRAALSTIEEALGELDAIEVDGKPLTRVVLENTRRDRDELEVLLERAWADRNVQVARADAAEMALAKLRGTEPAAHPVEAPPAERAIVVGSIVKHLPSGQFRKVRGFSLGLSSGDAFERRAVFEHPIQHFCDEVVRAPLSELELIDDPAPPPPPEAEPVAQAAPELRP